MKNLLVIDGNSIVYRAFYALNKDVFVVNDLHTNAIYGFIKMFKSFLKKSNYYNVIIAFDKGKKSFRNDIYKQYKENRKSTPKELIKQFEILKNEYLLKHNIIFLEKENYEADDIIGSLSNELSNDYNIDILTSDSDLLQLINNKVKVFICKKGVSILEEYNSNNFFSKKNYYPNQIPDIKSLYGDKTDNIIGIKGVSERIAIILLTLYNDIENLYKNINELEEKFLKYKNNNKDKKIRFNVEKTKKLLLENKEKVFLNKKIATIYKKIKFNLVIKELVYDEEKLIEFYDKYKMKSFIKENKKKNNIIFNEQKNCFVIENWKIDYNDKKNFLFLEFYDSNYHNSNILGFGIKNSKGNFFYSFNKFQNDKLFLEFLKNENIKKYTYNAKSIINGLKRYNIELKGIEYDMMLAIYTIDSSIPKKFDLYLKKIFPNIEIESEYEIYGKGVNKKTPKFDILSNYVCKKAILIESSYEKIINLLKKNKQFDLYQKIEFPLLFVLADMEYEGIKVNLKELEQQHNKIEYKLNNLEKNIYKKTKYVFNINSPKQVSELIYDNLKLLKSNKKKSSSSEILNKIINDGKDENELIKNILLYRKYQKLFSTYINGMKKYIDRDNKIHTIYLQNQTSTGRLSSIKPNMQNIASNDEIQKEIKKIFIPNNNKFIFVSYDYSQIELRILAEISKDESLLNAFKNNEDIHSNTAKKIFNLKNNEIENSHQRRIAKMVNFGIVYGMTYFGLQKDLHVSYKEANEIIKNYFESYPKIKNYIDEKIEFCKKNKYVETLFNRRRTILDINSSNNKEAEFSKRAAINMPIQGTSSDIVKISLINVFNEFKKLKLKSKIILQIHDELIFHVCKSELELIKKIVPKLMTEIPELKKWKVKLKVNSKIGENLFIIS